MRRSIMALMLASLVALASFAGCSREKAAPKPEGTAPAKASVAKAPAPAETPATTVKTFGWRGDGTGRFHGAQPPDAWSSDEKKNILWTLKVGKSYSSPVIAGDKLFITSEQEKLVCVDTITHKIAWEKNNSFEDLPAEMNAKEKRFPASAGFAAETPVTDGKFVWASFGTGIITCYDFDGNRKWVRYIDNPQGTEYGRTACPQLVDGKLIVMVGYLIALDPATGKTLWEAKDVAEMYGTPAVARVAKEALLVTPGGDVVKVSDGTILERGLAATTYASPVADGNVVYFGASRSAAFKLPEGAAPGKFAGTKLWELDVEGGEFFSSPVVYNGIFYVVSNEGFLSAVDAKLGTLLYKADLDIPNARGMAGEPADLYPSLAIAGGKLYIQNSKGYTLVVEPGKEYKKVTINRTEDGGGACPVFVNNLIYLRSGEDLLCIGNK